LPLLAVTLLTISSTYAFSHSAMSAVASVLTVSTAEGAETETDISSTAAFSSSIAVASSVTAAADAGVPSASIAVLIASMSA